MRNLTLLGAVLIALPVTAAADDGFKAMFTKHWKVAKEFTLAVADAMPAEDYDFKPNPEELSFGRTTLGLTLGSSFGAVMPTAT